VGKARGKCEGVGKRAFGPLADVRDSRFRGNFRGSEMLSLRVFVPKELLKIRIRTSAGPEPSGRGKRHQ
jgi:hypothetical protein